MWNKESRYHQLDVIEEVFWNVWGSSELKSMNLLTYPTNLDIVQLFSKAYLKL